MLRNPAAASIREVYKTLNKRIKHEIQVHKPKCLDQKIKQLQDDYVEKSNFNLSNMIRELDRKPKISLNMVIEKNGNKQVNINKVLKTWKQDFEKREY